MANSCIIIPQCRNSRNEVVDSKLFKDLLEYSSNDRAFAKQMYYLALDEDFVNSFRSKLEFDDNGEPTMRSLFEASKVALQDNKVIEMLNKRIAGTYSWEDALEKIRVFNSQEQDISVEEAYEDRLRKILADAPIDEQGRLLAPNGKPSNLPARLYAQVRTEEFRNWFGDWTKITFNEDGTLNIPDGVSKVVDENGEPKVVYRGSQYGIEASNRTYLYFTDSKADASIYAQGQFTKGGQLFKNNQNIKDGIISYIKNNYGIKYMPDYDDMLILGENQETKGKTLGRQNTSEENARLEFEEKFFNREIQDQKLYDFVRMFELINETTLTSEQDLIRQYDDTSYIEGKAELDNLFKKYQKDVSEFEKRQSGKVEPVFLSIKNPYTNEMIYEDLIDNQDAYLGGHDGAFLMHGQHFLVRKGAQIKSAEENNGAFSSSKNIYLNRKLDTAIDLVPMLHKLAHTSFEHIGKAFNNWGKTFWVNNGVQDADGILKRWLRNNNLPEDAVTIEGKKLIAKKLKDAIAENTINAQEEDTASFQERFEYEEVTKVLNYLKSKFGVGYKFVSEKEAKQLNPNLTTADNAFFMNGTAYFIKGRNLNTDIASEEMLHGFINAIYKDNRKLFDSLFKDACELFPKLRLQIERAYNDREVEERQQELVTQALSRAFREEIRNNPRGRKLVDFINKFMSWVRNFFSSDRSPMVLAWEIKEDTTLSDLAAILNIRDLYIGYSKEYDNVTRNNRSAQQWSKDYMATATPTGDGKYKIQAVKRTPAEEIKLQKTIANQTVQQKLISLLKSYGVAVDFLEDGKNQYSTENALRSADGLYHLIQIVQGKTDVTPEVAEEAGHFAIAALGNSPLVQRLEQLLTPEVQRQALGEEYDNKYLGRDARREVAGDLVGQALIKRMGNNAWGRLANRIADLAKRVFYKMKADEVSQMRLDAERIANQIARGFMSESFEGSLENALSTEETLYSAQYSEPVKAYKNMLVQLQTLASTLRATNSKWADRIAVIIAKAQFDRESKINTNIGALADSTALEGIAEAMDMLVDVMSNELPNLLNSVDFNNTFDFATNMARNGHSLREAHLITAACVNISKLIADTSEKVNYDAIVSYKDQITGTAVTKSIAELQQSLSKFTSKQGIGGFYNQLLAKEKTFFIKFLEDSYGKKYIERATRVVFDQKLAKQQGRWFVAIRQGREYGFDELLENLEQDISFFDKFVGAMADSGDIIGEIVDKTMKQANKEADDLTNKIWDDLRVLEETARREGIKDPEIIYERDKDGKLTGNLIDQLLWGVWERDYQEFMQEEKKKFLEAHANNPRYINSPELEKAFMWQAYFEPIRKDWHKKHSTMRPNEGWVPSDREYHNYQYDKLAVENPAAIKLLKEIMSIKEVLDSMVDNSMPTHRAPQFKGTFMNKVRNKGSRLKPSNYGAAWWDATKDAFVIDENDAAMYGSALTYNEPEEDMFANQVAFEKEKINRIPLFGINKLKNMDMLSTDIYASMLSYAGMATRYAASRQIVDTVEIGKEILRGRKVEGGKTEAEREKTSWAFTRYCKYLDKQVYGVGNKPIIIGKVILNKITSGFSMLASKLFLGGNVFGGLVNLGTGKIEIFKEALAAEYFDIADLTAAKKYYYSKIPATLLQIGKVAKDDELSLIMRHFNMLNNSRENQKQYSTYKSRVKHIYDESLLFPYTAGDHYMQSIPYLSLMHHQNLIGEDGKKAGNLLQLYQRAAAEFTDSAGRTKTSKKTHTITLKGPYFKTEEDRQTYLMLKDILQAIDSASGVGAFGAVLNFTQKQTDFLADRKWVNMDSEALRKLIKKEMHNVQWNSDDESALMDKAREIDDRLHGIYNEQDKTEMHQEIWGAMLLAMRGYALGMMQRRFGRSKYSVVLGGETEGNLLTFAKMIAAIGMDRWGFGKTIATMVWPWTKNAKARMEAAGFGTHQYRNIRRTWCDFVGVLLLTLIKALCAGDDDDKETEEDLEEMSQMLKDAGYTEEEVKFIMGDSEKAQEISLLGIGFYMVSRLLREQSAFNFIGAFIDEWSNITSLVPVGVSAVTSLWDVAYNMGGDLFFNYQNLDPEKYEILKGMGYTKEEIDEIKKADKEALKEAAGRHFFYQSDAADGSYKKGDAKWKRKLKLISTVPLPIYTNGEWDLYWNYWGKSERVLYHPYEAAKSYEYGRKVRN